MIDRYHGFQLIKYSKYSAVGEFLKEIIVGVRLPMAVLPSPKGPVQPWGDCTEGAPHISLEVNGTPPSIAQSN